MKHARRELRLWAIWKLLLWADALICGLPAPLSTSDKPYFDDWAAAGSVHGAISKAAFGAYVEGGTKGAEEWERQR